MPRLELLSFSAVVLLFVRWLSRLISRQGQYTDIRSMTQFGSRNGERILITKIDLVFSKGPVNKVKSRHWEANSRTSNRFLLWCLSLKQMESKLQNSRSLNIQYRGCLWRILLQNTKVLICVASVNRNQGKSGTESIKEGRRNKNKTSLREKQDVKKRRHDVEFF